MKKLPWFRAYAEMVDDEKLRLLAFEDRWHFVALLCLKGQGVLNNDDPLMMRKVAVKLGIDARTLEDVARRLAEVGLIDQETLQPLNWDSRQMSSDTDPTNAERQRRYRKRKQGEEAAEAEQKREEGQGNGNSNALRNGDITPLDIDTDKDKETDKEEKIKPSARAAAPAIDFSSWPAEPSPEVVADYLRHRKEIKAPLTQTAANRLGTEAQRAMAMGYSVDDFLAECMLRGWRGGKAEWLEQRSSPKPPGRMPTQAERNADWTARIWQGSEPVEKDMGVIDATAN